MIHRKARSLMSAPEAIATVAAAALSQAASQQTGPTGSVVTHNADGTQTIMGPVLGTDSTGTSVTTATHVGDTTPPGIPTGITAWSGDGSVHVSWDGTLEGGVPADFHCVNLLVDGTRVAQLAKAGSTTYLDVAVGTTVSVTATSEDDACAIDGTAAHNVSAACEAVSVKVTEVRSYIHIAYATSADGSTGFSTTDPTGKTYIGVLTDTTEADSTTYTDYTWSLIKGADGTDGTDGVPGPAGADGKTTYVHFAYASAADGSTGFSTTYFIGAEYVGTLTDFTQADSTTYTDYTWSRFKGDTGTTGAAGADALTLVVTSSNGLIFKNSSIATVLTAHVYNGGVEVTGTALAVLGTIRWYKDGSTTAAATTGATLTIDAGDVTGKATYVAQLEG